MTRRRCLRLGPPLISPHSKYPGYLGSIFTGVLKNALPFTVTWASQTMSAVAWLQVSMLSGYRRGEAMRAMHKGIHHGGDVSSLLYATPPPPVEVGRRPPGGGGG